MLARRQLAIIDFNEGSNLEQATTEKGEKRYNMQLSKITKAGPWNQSKKKKTEVIYILYGKRKLLNV